MKNLKNGDLVTPIVLDPRTTTLTKGKEYEVYNVYSNVFYIKNDNGLSRKCYISEKRIVFQKVNNDNSDIKILLREFARHISLLSSMTSSGDVTKEQFEKGVEDNINEYLKKINQSIR